MQTTLAGRTEGKRPLWRPRHLWEANIKKIVKYDVTRVNWIRLARDRIQWTRLFESRGIFLQA